MELLDILSQTNILANFSDFHWSIQNESACIPQVSKAASQRLPDRSPAWKDFCDLQEQSSLQSTPEVSPLSLG